MQLLPVEDMRHGLANGREWELLADGLYRTSMQDVLEMPGETLLLSFEDMSRTIEQARTSQMSANLSTLLTCHAQATKRLM